MSPVTDCGTPADRELSPAPEQLLSLAAEISGSRDKRRLFLSADLFAEPGWEMLIALYRADAAGHRMTTSNLCLASRAPETTALRWVEKLIELRLVSRRRNPLDARVFFIEFEPHGRQAIHAYLVDLWNSLRR